MSKSIFIHYLELFCIYEKKHQNFFKNLLILETTKFLLKET